MRAGGAQEAGAPGRAEQLDGLHRREDEPEAPAGQPEGAAVGDDGLHGEPARCGPHLQLGEELGVDVERDDVMALRGEVERDAAGPRADVEDRPGLGGGELAPERDVGVIGAALDVVPDDVGARRHANEPSAAPRATSSSRSASIAV